MIDALPLLLGPDGYQISRSVRLRSSASAYFNRTPGSATNRKTWTWSGWHKRGRIAVDSNLFAAFITNTNQTDLSFASSDDKLYFTDFQTSARIGCSTNAVFRDPSAWYHVLIAVDTTQATNSNGVKIFINGVQQALTFTAYTQNQDTMINSTNAHQIGARFSSSPYYQDGYLTEVNFIDGQALTPASFGETDALTGVWKPKKYTGTYGTNGFYLNFSDNSAATAAAIGKDYSGNGNNWTPNNISVTAGVTYDSMLDVPTPWADGGNGRGNYCTLNPLDNSQNAATGTLSNGNLTRTDSTATNTATFGTMFVSSGQWYYEVLIQAISSTTANCFVGLSTNNKAVFVALRPDGSVLNCTKSGSGTYTTNDVLGVAVDIAANTVYVYKNGTLLYTLTPTTAMTDFTPAIADGTTLTAAVTASFNFGQRPFAYTPPSGFKALNTQNLPEPTILKGNQYFDVVLRTGNGSSQSSTGLAFGPDLSWTKARGLGYAHKLQDKVRGAGLALASSSSAAEISESGVTSFNADGVTYGSAVDYNQNAATYVDWLWKESASAGFDIVTYTGNGTNGQTVAHSLGVKPDFVIIKKRANNTATNTGTWICQHKSLTAGVNASSSTFTLTTYTNGALYLNTTNAQSTYTYDNQVGGNGDTFVAYLFAEVAGFSKFGSYTGNGSTDGPFVFCGFRPRYVLVKRTDGADSWQVWDTARDTYNVTSANLYPNLSNAEVTDSTQGIDIVANGFKLRTSNVRLNASGGTYIFAAFSEVGFKYALGR